MMKKTVFIFFSLFAIYSLQTMANTWKPTSTCGPEKFRCPGANFKCIKYPNLEKCEVIKINKESNVKTVVFEDWCAKNNSGQCIRNNQCKNANQVSVVPVNPFAACAP